MYPSLTRRDFVAAGSALATGVVLAGSLAAAEGKKVLAYFGTYTGAGENKSQGIYFAEFDTATGKLGAPRLAVKAEQPSFVAIHPNGKHLYACGETGNFGGEKGGALTAYAITDDGTLKQ